MVLWFGLRHFSYSFHSMWGIHNSGYVAHSQHIKSGWICMPYEFHYRRETQTDSSSFMTSRDDRAHFYFHWANTFSSQISPGQVQSLKGQFNHWSLASPLSPSGCGKVNFHFPWLKRTFCPLVDGSRHWNGLQILLVRLTRRGLSQRRCLNSCTKRSQSQY